MLSPFNAAPLRDFNAFPRSPAVSLTENLPPNVRANCLLLSAGDPRHIFYTIHRENADKRLNRVLDITCCDEEAAVLARNVFLFTLLLETDSLTDGGHWTIFYEYWIGKAEVKTIRNHAAKLVRVSKDLEAWSKSNFGELLSMVNKETLKALRQCWLQYFDPKNSDREARFKFHLAAAKADKRKADTSERNVTISNLSRGFGPLAYQSAEFARVHATISCEVDCQCQNSPGAECLNPLFAYSFGSGKEFSIRASTNFLMGFHLAPSIVSPSSYLHPTDAEVVKVKLVAIGQFQEWRRSFRLFAKTSRLRLRFFVGEPIPFCYALDQLRTGIPSNILATYVQPWSGNPLVLDGAQYVGTPSAPLSFNVVDASDLVDTVGALNLLVSVIPILEQSSWTTLHTDVTFFPDTREKETVLLSRLLHADPRIICTLLGLAPVTLLTGITTTGYHHGHAHIQFAKKYCHHLTWKFVSMGDISSNVRVSCNPEDLGELLAEMYFKMFPHQRGDNPFESFPMLYPGPGFGRKFNPPHYTQTGFAAFLAFLKPRIMGDWDQTMAEFLGSLNTEHDFYGVPTQHMQDNCLQLYLAGTDRHIRKFKVNTGPNPPPHNVIPSSAVTCVILTVPRQALQVILRRYPKMEERFNHRVNLFFRVHIASGRPAPNEFLIERMNRVQLYCSPIPMFGKLITAPNGKTCTIETDHFGWIGTSDLHISVLVPTRSLELMREGPAPTIDLQLNPENGSVAALGGIQNIDIYSAPLFDKSKVKFVEALPGRPAFRPTLLQSPEYEWELYDDTATPPRLSTLDMTFNSRLTFRQESTRFLLSSGAPVTVDGSTPCSVSIRCRTFLYKFLFPYPIIARRANVKLSRKAGWIEITVPLADSKEGGYVDNRFPLLPHGHEVCNWNLPNIRLNTLTRIDNTNEEVGKWVTKHLNTMFSKREHVLLTANPQVNVPGFTLFKKSIYDILVTLTRTPNRIHAIKANADDNDGKTIVLIAGELYLNDTTSSIVAEAYATPCGQSCEQHKERVESPDARITLVVGKEAYKIWTQALTAMIECCRDWDHRLDCAAFNRRFTSAMNVAEESSVCYCCVLNGKPKGTPLALLPIFGVPYLEELRDRNGIGDLSGEFRELKISGDSQSKSNTQKGGVSAKSGDQSKPGTQKDGQGGSGTQNSRQRDSSARQGDHSDSSIQNGGNVLCKCCQKVATKRCSKCNVKYCSQECQRQDWKQHKMVCAGNKK